MNREVAQYRGSANPIGVPFGGPAFVDRCTRHELVPRGLGVGGPGLEMHGMRGQDCPPQSSHRCGARRPMQSVLRDPQRKIPLRRDSGGSWCFVGTVCCTRYSSEWPLTLLLVAALRLQLVEAHRHQRPRLRQAQPRLRRHPIRCAQRPLRSTCQAPYLRLR